MLLVVCLVGFCAGCQGYLSVARWGRAVNPRDGERFLADHTLGRTWCEMRQGRTRLAEQCAGIVHSDEVFQAESTPGSDDAGSTTRATRSAAHCLSGEPVPEPEALPLAHTVNAFRTLSGDQGVTNREATRAAGARGAGSALYRRAPQPALPDLPEVAVRHRSPRTAQHPDRHLARRGPAPGRDGAAAGR